MRTRGVALGLLGLASASAEGPFRGVQMHADDFDYIRTLAEKIVSPGAMEAFKNADKLGHVDLSVFDASTLGEGHRRLGATDEECGVFLAASVAPNMWECFDMAQTVLQLVRQENCKTVYDFSQSNMQRICTNHCYDALRKTLVTMSEAGCSASILKQSCSECASGEKCVGTKCRQVCSATLPCSCDYTCENGACIPPKNSEVTVNDLGVNGYRIALDYLCSQAPTTKKYCFSEIFSVMNDVDASTFCSKISPVGCCTGTVFSFVTDCATANDTIATSVGSISLSDLQEFCPEVDFLSPCSNVEPIPKGACLEGFSLSAAWPSARASSMVLISALAALAVAMAF